MTPRTHADFLALALERIAEDVPERETLAQQYADIEVALADLVREHEITEPMLGAIRLAAGNCVDVSERSLVAMQARGLLHKHWLSHLGQEVRAHLIAVAVIRSLFTTP